MGGQFEKAIGKFQLKAGMPAVVPAVEALMRAPGADEIILGKAWPPVMVLGLSVLSRPAIMTYAVNCRIIRVANFVVGMALQARRVFSLSWVCRVWQAC